MAMKNLACVMIMVVVVVVNSPSAMAALTCGQVVGSLSPCITYAKGNGAGKPPGGCCSGISAVNNMAKTTPDRQTACRCLKSAASQIPGINYNLVASLPSKCNVNIPYKISPSTNCDSIR